MNLLLAIVLLALILFIVAAITGLVKSVVFPVLIAVFIVALIIDIIGIGMRMVFGFPGLVLLIILAIAYFAVGRRRSK